MKKLAVLLYLFMLWPAITSALPGIDPSQDVKPSHEVFVIDIEVTDPNKVKVGWTIAENHYMYLKKIKFKSDTEGVTIGEVKLPEGKIKNDKYLGKVTIIHNRVETVLPINNDAGIENFVLKVVSQGCAEKGICYPPLKQKYDINLKTGDIKDLKPPKKIPLLGNDSLFGGGQSSSLPVQGTAVETAPEQPTPVVPVLDKTPVVADNQGFEEVTPKNETANKPAPNLAEQLGLTEIGDNTQEGSGESVSADEAFKLSLSAIDKNTIEASWEIKPGQFLYRSDITFTLLTEKEGVSLGEAVFPTPEMTSSDEYSEPEPVYKGSFKATIPLVGDADDIEIRVDYKGCSGATGICYPPLSKTAKISMTAKSEAVIGTLHEGSSMTDKIAATLAGESLSWTLVTFFGFGLLLAFTPCIFPMIPILSGIIVGGQHAGGSKKSTKGSMLRAFSLSLAYVLAMALTYTVVGIIAGLTGANLQIWFQNPWVLGSFSALFVALAFAMFGFYELQLPTALQTRLTGLSNKQKSGSLIGAAIMGFLSALIVGPCVTAPLVGALIYISQSGDWVLGGLALFTLSMGMGTPLLVIGTTEGKLLPRAGGWMDVTKHVFGVIFLGVAIWMLERVVPTEVTLLLFGVLLVGSGIYMGALEPTAIRENRDTGTRSTLLSSVTTPDLSSGWTKLWKSVGLVFVLYGAMMIVGAAAGSKNMMQPLKGVFNVSNNAQGSGSDALVQFDRIKSLANLKARLAEAKNKNQIVMLDFYADWCVSCKEMEHSTFVTPSVGRSLEGVVMLQADVTADDEQDQELMRKFGIFGPPAILFFTPDGREVRKYRLAGYEGPDEFSKRVRQVKQTIALEGSHRE